jgi:hypothetical protein
VRLGSFKIDFSHKGKFRFFSCREVFSKDAYAALQDAFDHVPWVKKKDPFYTQYESFVKPSDPHALASLYDPAFFLPFKAKVEEHLGVRLQDRARLAAHKLVTSDEIGLHNDYTLPEVGEESVRFLFQFARPHQPIKGGELSFFSSRYTREVIRTYPYSENGGVCFQITPDSYHAVSAVEGERHTLVMYLWEEGRLSNDKSIVIK